MLRGSDLLDSTARQIFVQQKLGYPTPVYCHLPVITNEQGQKFSKQSHAPALHNDRATDNIRCALQFLRQGQPPNALTRVEDLLNYATEHWALQQVPARMAVHANTLDQGT